MLSSFENVNLGDELLKLDLVELNGGTKDFIKYQLARSYFNLKEYARATFHLSECDSSAAYFLYVYSKYMVNIFCSKKNFSFFLLAYNLSSQ